MVTSCLLILLGFFMLIKGADFLVDGASEIAKRFRIPEIVIGLTIVSIGTSLPELFVSTTSALNGSSDMAIGNVIGSNISNLLLILGLSALIKPVTFKKESRFVEIPLCLLFSVFFALFCNSSNTISKMESVVLLLFFVIFIIYTLIIAFKGKNIEGEEIPDSKVYSKINITKNILCIILGVIGLKIGGDLTVDNAVIIANEFNLSEKVIGLTILAIGTSLPELVTSAIAAFRGNSDIAVGNIIGSNIFNLLLITGVSAFISPLSYNPSYNIQQIFLLFSTFILFVFPFIPPKNQMSRINGFTYLLMYAVYMVALFLI